MCFFSKPKKTPALKPLDAPEKPAEPEQIGAERTEEDQMLFGGVPELRFDRSATSGGATAGGTGLKAM